jgi:NADH-quinone oxidoreductase subunit E
MLTEEEIRKIEETVRIYPHRRAGCVEAMRTVQEKRGWVGDAEIAEIARLLGMTADELDGVATFYPFIFRKPVGRHVICVCDSVACWVMGHEAVLEALKLRLGVSLGGTTADGRFTLLPISCIGACDRAPAIMIDGDLYGPVAPDGIPAILGGYK